MNAILAVMVVLWSGATPKPKAFDGKPDAFRIDFRGPPKMETIQDKDLVTRTYRVDNDFGIYLVIVMNDSDLTPENAKESFASFRDSEKEDAKIVAEKPLTLGGFPGLELKTQGKEMDSIARMYVGKGRAWTLVVDADHGHSFAELGADPFFASFSITDQTAPTAPPPGPPPPPAARGPLSPDGVELVGWTPDGSKVVAIEHGVSDGKGTPWARATFFDTAKGAALGKPLQVELEGDATEGAAVAEMRKRAEAERVRLKLPTLVRGKTINTDAKGELTGADGSPTGSLEIKTRKAGKKRKGRECGGPFGAELLTVKLFLLGGDAPISVLNEKKVPAARACSGGCTAGATYGQGQGALFVLKCQVQGFEGPATQPFLVPLGRLEFPLQADLPPQ